MVSIRGMIIGYGIIVVLGLFHWLELTDSPMDALHMIAFVYCVDIHCKLKDKE